MTSIELGVFVNVTIASSLSETSLPSSSLPDAVTTFVWEPPALPETAAENEQLYVSPAAIVCGTSQVPFPSRLPNLSSVRLEIVTESTADVFLTETE